MEPEQRRSLRFGTAEAKSVVVDREKAGLASFCLEIRFEGFSQHVQDLETEPMAAGSLDFRSEAIRLGSLSLAFSVSR